LNINEAIEATRKKQKECRREFVKYLFLGIFFIAILPLSGIFVAEKIFRSELGVIFIIIGYIPIFIVSWVTTWSNVIEPLWVYEEFYKDVYIRTIISDINQAFSYEPSAGISREEFKKIGIYAQNKFRAEDQISGIYNGVKFSLSEAIDIPNDAKLNLGDSPGLNLISLIFFAWSTMKDVQAFSGSVLVCEFYKKFSGQTIVASCTLNTKFLGEKEQMDDTLFNDEFRVFTKDKVEARYLLTPAFMARLRELKIKYASQMGVSAAFMDDKFYLFLNGAKNRFETTLFSLPPSLEDAALIKKEILELLSIIDELNLNLDIFKLG